MTTAWKALALIVFGLTVALLLLEGAFRLAGVGGPAELRDTYDRPQTGYPPHPDLQHPFTAQGGDVLKVAVVGDSFTNGFGNQWHDNYPRRLERLLNLNVESRPAEVRVWAQNGTSTAQQLAFLDDVLEYQPELLILGIFLNDFEDRGDPKVQEFLRAMKPRQPTGWRRSVLRSSRALAWIYLRLEYVRTRRVAVAFQEYSLRPGYPGFKKFRNAVGKFADSARRHDIRFVAVIWPTMGGLGPNYPHFQAHLRIRSVLRRENVPYLELLGAFRDKSSSRMAIYPEVDEHPSEIAHRIGASAIFEFLLANGHIDSSYEPWRNRVGGRKYWLARTREKFSPLYPLERRKQKPQAEAP